MNPESANKFLKTLEEPPPNTLLLLVSDQVTSIMPTILSRCQRILLPRDAGFGDQPWIEPMLQLLRSGPPTDTLRLLGLAKAFDDVFALARKEIEADVLEALYPLLLKRGRPEYIRSDNGPEFIATGFQQWLVKVGTKPIPIYPASPWENGYNDRFNGTLRNEVLNAEWFHTTKQAQTAINVWLRQYNEIRPHHALAMRTPVPETLTEKTQISGPGSVG